MVGIVEVDVNLKFSMLHCLVRGSFKVPYIVSKQDPFMFFEQRTDMN